MIHPPDRVPNLEREDLELILSLIEMVPEDKGVLQLKRKVESSMSVYHWQDSIIEAAGESLRAKRNRDIS